MVAHMQKFSSMPQSLAPLFIYYIFDTLGGYGSQYNSNDYRAYGLGAFYRYA
jgi:hypothetical protein